MCVCVLFFSFFFSSFCAQFGRDWTRKGRGIVGVPDAVAMATRSPATPPPSSLASYCLSNQIIGFAAIPISRLRLRHVPSFFSLFFFRLTNNRKQKRTRSKSVNRYRTIIWQKLGKKKKNSVKRQWERALNECLPSCRGLVSLWFFLFVFFAWVFRFSRLVTGPGALSCASGGDEKQIAFFFCFSTSRRRHVCGPHTHTHTHTHTHQHKSYFNELRLIKKKKVHWTFFLGHWVRKKRSFVLALLGNKSN